MSIQNDQEVADTCAALRQALLDLHIYGTTHTVDGALEKDIKALTAVGALSTQSAAFIAAHRVRFLGFKPKPIKPDIAVLEIELANRTPPLHFIGYRDGHVEVKGYEE